jgi:hypothetical protein
MDLKPLAMTLRRCTVEHVFGTLKYWMGWTHFLTRKREAREYRDEPARAGLQPEEGHRDLGYGQDDEGDEFAEGREPRTHSFNEGSLCETDRTAPLQWRCVLVQLHADGFDEVAVQAGFTGNRRFEFCPSFWHHDNALLVQFYSSFWPFFCAAPDRNCAAKG